MLAGVHGLPTSASTRTVSLPPVFGCGTVVVVAAAVVAVALVAVLVGPATTGVVAGPGAFPLGPTDSVNSNVGARDCRVARQTGHRRPTRPATHRRQARARRQGASGGQAGLAPYPAVRTTGTA